ncbi:hypothetical protein E5Q_00135 [Mixia osmundae IAM 14324]|uniref:BHLH domain-containing protein n=2 Tax=Mixia osmundae (strain CBS 9802 / IAM 14324 / JCM 22182 / KY 12970) TaxID=764103 RepID=G7DSD4_MIXOS|nr:hypothetical protein E5Q_00135 [Mixia osmundae IAM 14324]
MALPPTGAGLASSGLGSGVPLRTNSSQNWLLSGDELSGFGDFLDAVETDRSPAPVLQPSSSSSGTHNPTGPSLPGQPASAYPAIPSSGADRARLINSIYASNSHNLAALDGSNGFHDLAELGQQVPLAAAAQRQQQIFPESAAYGRSRHVERSQLPMVPPPRDAETRDRMEAQARELTHWLAARGIDSSASSASNSPVRGHRPQQPIASTSMTPHYAQPVAPKPTRMSDATVSTFEAGAHQLAQPDTSDRSSSGSPEPAAALQERRRDQRPSASHNASKGKAREINTQDTQAAHPKATLSRSAPAGTGGSRMPLLSEEQKRANHIASEQKRRAAIRAAYDSLAAVVPSLNDAPPSGPADHRRSMSHEDDEGDERDGGETIGRGKRKRKPVPESQSSKPEARPGAKSEAVVLSKTVEYLRELHDQREALLDRLERAQALLAQRGQPCGSRSPVWNLAWQDDASEGGEGSDSES